MFDLTVILPFIIACSFIIISPGPAQALVLSVTVSYGKRAGLLTVLGLNSSMIVHISAAAIGISTLLAASSEAFMIVKYLGAVYLVYIGIQSLRSHADENNAAAEPAANSRNIFWKAFLTGALNPKVAIFFLAFIPQFISFTKGWLFLQFLILGIILAGMDIIYESILVVLIEKIRVRINNSSAFRFIRHKLAGFVMIILGIRLAFLKNN